MFDRDLIARARAEKQSGILRRAGSFNYVLFLEPVSMRPIVRTEEELFTTTVERRSGGFEVIVNGNFFDATFTGLGDAGWGTDPVPAGETIVLGQVVEAGKPTLGDSRPLGFHIAEIAEPGANGRPGRLRYVTGLGDPPQGGRTVSGLGNTGPLISGGLPYGAGNRYRPPTTGPSEGDPGPERRAALVQRNSAAFRQVDVLAPATGKTIIAWHAREQALLVGVQGHGGGAGQTHAQLRDGLIAAGFSDAVFLDGSDSALMYYRGRRIVAPGEDKNELMTVGLGFVRRRVAR